MLEPEFHSPSATEVPEEMADDGERVAIEVEPEELDPAELADDGNRLVPGGAPDDLE